MKVDVGWLKELCPTDLSAESMAEALTSIGAEVEEILRPWDGLEGVVTAKVLEVGDHPSSDKLCLARVSFGSGERELVVGVRNMQAGDVVPLAGPGASVPALSEPLAAKPIRGVTSEGMLCSPRELGISADHGGILVLPPDTPVGVDFKQHFGLDDAVLDIAVTPNRPDLMSVIGVAREVGAATGTKIRAPVAELDEADEKAESAATVEVRDPERCPRYLARVIRGVMAGPSPLLVQARLTASGMRPVSNVVDATNYVMLELGQPMHPFDLAGLAGGAVVVRRAEQGERMTTLDDVRPERASALLGQHLSAGDVEDAFTLLGIPAVRRDWNVEVEVPGYRVDLEREIDLVEEVARVRGYERIEATVPGIRQAGGLPDTYRLRRRIREAAVRAGLREVKSLSFVSQADLRLVGDHEAVRVANPLRAEEGFLRTSLLPGLLHALQDRKSTRLNSSHRCISYAVFCLKKKTTPTNKPTE